jgi:hypothetical protein
MASQLVWPHVVRPAVPILYLDLNHFINLAKIRRSVDQAPASYPALDAALRSAVHSGRVLVPLSAPHVWEMYVRITDPRQRQDVAAVMEELSGFNYLLGRTDLGQLEIEAGMRAVLGEPDPPVPLPLIRPTMGHALGMVGGLKIVDAEGKDVSAQLRAQMGPVEYDAFMASSTLAMERALLAGPTDEDAELLRSQYGYAPEMARMSGESRLAFEEDLSDKLKADERWRRGRLRDVVSAREFAHEWLEVWNRVNQERVAAGQSPFDVNDLQMLALIGAMPHAQVAISLKTRLHRNPSHRWTTNDIVDIDALSVAFAYCDAVLTDRAMRNALASAPELRSIPTVLPDGPLGLVEWLDSLAPTPLGRDFLIGVSRSRLRTT